MVGFCADKLFFVGVKDHQVGVRAHGDGSFPRVEAEEFPGGRRNQFHKAVRGEAPAVDATGRDKTEAVLNSRPTVGDFREVVLAQLLLVFVAEGAMVGRNNLEMVSRQAGPEFILVPLLA